MTLSQTYISRKQLLVDNLVAKGVTGYTVNDGLTTLINAVLEIQGGGVKTLTLTSDKDILSYVDSESATLTATLLEDGVGVSGATVEFFNGSTSLGTAQTDSTGVATKTYTSTGAGDVSLKAEADNGMILSKTYSIIDKILYDDCSSDKSNKFDVANQITTYGSNANIVITYDSTNKHYIVDNTNNNNSTGFVPIIGLDGLDDVRLEMDIYLNINRSGLNCGWGILNTSSSNCIIFNIGNPNNPMDIFETSDHLFSGTTTNKVWSKLIIEKTGKQLQVTLKKADGSINCSISYTMSMTPNNTTKYGIVLYKGDVTGNVYLKNMVIEPL